MKINRYATKTGYETIEIDGYLLHSKYDPIKEAIRIVEKEFEFDYIYVLFGYGLGFIANELINKIKNEKVLCFEPNHALEIKEQQDVELIRDLKELEYNLSELTVNYTTKIKLICSPNYNNLFEEEYKEVLKVIKTIQNENIVSENTVRLLGETWQENYIENLVHLVENPSLTELNEKYDCPIIIASGGPSLTKQLDQLKKIQDDVIIISAGSTINSLLASDIEPDYVVSIDGGELNLKHFENLNLKKAKLIFAMSSNWKVQESYKGEKYNFIFYGEDDLRDYIYRELNIELPFIYTGGSVANSALHIASYISTGPIAIIGQDLAYTNNLSHASANKYFTEVDEEFLSNRNAFETEGYYGDLVKTDYSLYSMKKTFEKIYLILKNTHEIYNCTEGGVKIEGMPQISFVEFCEKFVNQTLNKSSYIDLKHKTRSLTELEEFLIKEIEKYSKLTRYLFDNVSKLKSNNSDTSFNPKVLKELEKNDVKIGEIFKNIMMERIVEPITMDVMKKFPQVKNESNQDSYKRIYNQNMELYLRLLEATKKTKEFAERVLKKIKY